MSIEHTENCCPACLCGKIIQFAVVPCSAEMEASSVKLVCNVQTEYNQKVYGMAQVSISKTQKVVSIFLHKRIKSLESEMHAVCKRFQDHVDAAILMKAQGIVFDMPVTVYL